MSIYEGLYNNDWIWKKPYYVTSIILKWMSFLLAADNFQLSTRMESWNIWDSWPFCMDINIQIDLIPWFLLSRFRMFWS